MGQTDQSAQEGATSDEPSVSPVGQADLDKWRDSIVTTLNKSFDDRFKGFQGIISKRDEKIEELATMLTELKTADLSDDERVQLEKDALKQERSALAAERELMAMQADFPDEIDLYRKVLDAGSSKDQIALLRGWRESFTGNQEPEPAVDGQDNPLNLSAVDPNNPPAPSDDGMDYESQFERDPSLVDKLLRSAKTLSGGG